MAQQLDLAQPVYIVRAEATRPYTSETSCIGDQDYLTNNPNELTDNLGDTFRFDPDQWEGDEEVTDQRSYNAYLNSLHVQPASGEVRQDRFGGWWYCDDGTWHRVQDDGEVHYCPDIAGPDDLAGWEPMPDWYAVRDTIHPSWYHHPDYIRMSQACQNSWRNQYVPEGTGALLQSRDWTQARPSVTVDLTSCVLASGIELVRLTDAIERGIARFVAIGGLPVLEVKYHGLYDQSPWRDVHVFSPGRTAYTNISAAHHGHRQFPWHYDTPDNPVCQAPDNIADWYIGYREAGRTSTVVWTLSPFGLDHTEGGETRCSLTEAAHIVGAERAI